MSTKPGHSRLRLCVSLPLVAVVIFLVLALLAERQRQEVISRLTVRANQGSDLVAQAAVRQMASMPYPPIPQLVTAAASFRRPVALEAQQVISDMMRRWQRRLNAGHRGHGIAEQVSTLVASLAQERDNFSQKDRRWVSTSTRKLLRMANQLPTDAPMTLAAECELILASIEPADEPAIVAASIGPATTTGPPTDAALALALPNDDSTSAETLDLTPESDPADEPSSLSVWKSARHDFAASDVEPPVDASVVTSETQQLADALPSTDIAAESQEPSFAMSDEPPTHAQIAEQANAAWQPQWLRPMPDQADMPLVGTAPIANRGARDLVAKETPGSDIIEPERSNDPVRRLRSAGTIELLERWLTAEDSAAPPIERALARRGFRQLSRRIVEQCVSQNPADRVQLAEDLLSAPEIDVRPWLLLFADDPSPDVRLTAVTAMATSDDPRLIDKAWSVVLHDRDPRISALAPRLRARRDGIQRR